VDLVLGLGVTMMMRIFLEQTSEGEVYIYEK
jgi:hypothetical protein